MASVLDVAGYILGKQGSMTAWKLQKLVYYSQAWSLVWDEQPLFQEKIRAWANGPAIRELHDLHKGQFEVQSLGIGDPSKLTDAEKETIDAVLEAYGDKSAQWLSDLTHMEEPWRVTRKRLPPGRACDREITHECMHRYYSSLPPSVDEDGEEES
jgi:uncharacterized phage-associated protein